MPGTNLTRDEAAARAALVDIESYDVSVDVTTSETTFATRSVITLTCRTPGAGTFIDFIGDSVQSIDVDGQSLDPGSHYADSRIQIPALAARSVITIEATGTFMTTGEGLHRFVDPVDEAVYLYTQFEVPDSRRMFPVFEQPDLKATFAFTVTAPGHWRVISAMPTPEPEPLDNERSVWRFEPTPRISSYVTSMIAGPYDVVNSSAPTRAGEIPMSLYSRKSLTPYVDSDEIFDITRAGMTFYEDLFDVPFPFVKYDQIFTPEFNAGAMENVGAVTFNEVYIFRSKVSRALVERRALTILHELAHMWFGDLVTMKWWDDLWLNESFAEWASTTCQAEATRWSDAWTTFASYEKDWAYRQDQLSTTHPIVAPIRDLHDVEVNFDGITYAKGSSVLKQLVAYVGREEFVAGLRAYFAKHAWGNTTLNDLLVELEAASGRDLRGWAKVWLETAGVNTLTPNVVVDDRGLISSATIEQTAPAEHPTVRPHRLSVGLYDVQGADLVRTREIAVDVDGSSTPVDELVGLSQSDLLLINDLDLAYAKIRLDQRSLATALAHPRGFTDSLPRALVLGSTWDMTRDGEMPARRFIDFVLASLPGETDSTLLRTLLAQLRTATLAYTSAPFREATRARVRDDLWALALAAEPGSDAQLQLVGSACELTASGDDVTAMTQVLAGTFEIPGYQVDFEARWTLTLALAAAGAIDAAAIDAEVAREDTATARERAARALAARPDLAAKEAAWDQGVLRRDASNAILDAIGAGFARYAPGGLLEPFVPRYFDMLAGLESVGSHAIVEAIVLGFYPASLASAELVDAGDAWLAANDAVAAGIRRMVTENRDATARAVRAQARDVEADSGSAGQG